mmetsp:Transcript_55100/g.131308  ORF Transcript_55100/g.131308 Transcript_55100/m.131308 type:complete len:465 (+) Transcript_55100:93-1487(+)
MGRDFCCPRLTFCRCLLFCGLVCDVLLLFSYLATYGNDPPEAQVSRIPIRKRLNKLRIPGFGNKTVAAGNKLNQSSAGEAGVDSRSSAGGGQKYLRQRWVKKGGIVFPEGEVPEGFGGVPSEPVSTRPREDLVIFMSLLIGPHLWRTPSLQLTLHIIAKLGINVVVVGDTDPPWKLPSCVRFFKTTPKELYALLGRQLDTDLPRFHEDPSRTYRDFRVILPWLLPQLVEGYRFVGLLDLTEVLVSSSLRAWVESVDNSSHDLYSIGESYSFSDFWLIRREKYQTLIVPKLVEMSRTLAQIFSTGDDMDFDGLGKGGRSQGTLFRAKAAFHHIVASVKDHLQVADGCSDIDFQFPGLQQAKGSAPAKPLPCHRDHIGMSVNPRQCCRLDMDKGGKVLLRNLATQTPLVFCHSPDGGKEVLKVSAIFQNPMALGSPKGPTTVFMSRKGLHLAKARPKDAVSSFVCA